MTVVDDAALGNMSVNIEEVYVLKLDGGDPAWLTVTASLLKHPTFTYRFAAVGLSVLYPLVPWYTHSFIRN